MKIDTIRVKNFRCYTESKGGLWGLEFRPNPDHNLIIGPNGAGKTALLDAIDLVMNVEGRTNQSLISEYDFSFCNTVKNICIEAVLTDIGHALGEFESDIQWIDSQCGEPIEYKALEIDETNQERAVLIRFEAWLDSNDGEIKWAWVLPKFPETGFEKQKELSKSQHRALGYFRIRPTITAGAFTLGQYSPLGRHLRKLQYRLGRLPDKLRGGAIIPECLIETPKCDQCGLKADCLPEIDVEENDGKDNQKKAIPIGMALNEIVTGAKRMLGSHGWNEMDAGLGPRYGGMRSSLAALTLGLKSDKSVDASFIPFERLSAGEKYALSFSLAKTQVPGDSPPVIIVEEPETALYQSALAKLMGDLQATPSGDTPQVIVSSHSEGVLRCFSTQYVFILDHNRIPHRVKDIITQQNTSKQLMSRLETLIMGGASALFADKILLVEGAEDTLVSGKLDRLAAATAAKNKDTNFRSFAYLGWCVFSSDNASNAIDFVTLFRKFGKRVAALFDGDGPGKREAEKTKGLCPTFIYKSADGGNPELEEALLKGLPEIDKGKVLERFYDIPCTDCDKKDRQCWKQGSPCDLYDDKTARKKKIQSLCLEQYFMIKRFPPAFQSLLKKINTAKSGEIHKLMINTVDGK